MKSREICFINSGSTSYGIKLKNGYTYFPDFFDLIRFTFESIVNQSLEKRCQDICVRMTLNRTIHIKVLQRCKNLVFFFSFFRLYFQCKFQECVQFVVLCQTLILHIRCITNEEHLFSIHIVSCTCSIFFSFRRVGNFFHPLPCFFNSKFYPCLQ